MDFHPLLARLQTRQNAHIALLYAVVRGKEIDQGVVGLAVDRARGEPDLDAIAVASGEFGARGPGLNMQLEDHDERERYKEATAGRMCQSTISTTWTRTTSTSGVRSNWPTGGM